MPPKISIIIRSFNEEKHIARLLTGIQQQDMTSEEVEVILVDSGSTDATVNIATHYDIKIISIKPEDFSFGYALNVGCEQAKGEILLFASAHVYPTYKDWLAQMLKPFEDDKVALVYGKQRGNEITKYSEHQLFKKWFPESSDFNQIHPFCNNANAAIRRELWKEQPYDEALTGLEDLDWAKKILNKGYKLVYNAEAEIIHVHEETPKRVLNRYRREAIALKYIMPEAKFSFFDFIQLSISNIFSDWLHSSKEKVFFKNFWDICIFRFMQFWGTYKGYRQKKPIDTILKKRFYYPNAITMKTMEFQNTKKLIDYSESSQ
ncbi:glycosyltransferase [Bernardetia sp.]|uniref:glycosyltransferase n=1 Tax=Bernardetia sp. TaxID=1937974 RepID=UPI0025C02AD9|nr:glycosyltransferase [Bernardetia sp.]